MWPSEDVACPKSGYWLSRVEGADGRSRKREWHLTGVWIETYRLPPRLSSNVGCAACPLRPFAQRGVFVGVGPPWQARRPPREASSQRQT
jgi:hypothetical protein